MMKQAVHGQGLDSHYLQVWAAIRTPSKQGAEDARQIRNNQSFLQLGIFKSC